MNDADQNARPRMRRLLSGHVDLRLPKAGLAAGGAALLALLALALD